MSDRLGSLAWMGAIVFGLAVMYWPGDDTGEESRPISDDARAAGLAAFTQWVEASGIETAALRRRYTALTESENGPRGNLLIAHVPMVLVPESDELVALKNWVAAGNTLLVSASLLESPAWHLTGGSVFAATEALGGLDLSFKPTDDDATDDERADEDPPSMLDAPGWVAFSGSVRTATLAAVSDHPLGNNFDDVVVPWDGTRIRRTNGEDCACADEEDSAADSGAAPARSAAGDWIAAIAHAGTDQTVVWERELGAGHVIVLAHPSLLANAGIREHANRRFAMNLVASRLGPTGRVIIDDAHQGANDLYTPSDLLTDVRVAKTIAFLLLCWAIYVLADAGSWERATRARSESRRGQADLVRASGGYLARRLHPHALVDGLLAPLRERLAKKWNLPIERALAEGLALERLDPAVTNDITRTLSGRARTRNAVKLHNLILKMRREMR